MIQLVSGGLDSILIWRLLGCPDALYVKLHTPAMLHEMTVLQFQGDMAGTHNIMIRDCPMNLFEKGNGYVPYRNLILVALAAQIDPEVVVSQVAEWAPDKNHRFWRRVTRLLNQAGRGSTQGMNQRAKVSAPFASWTKGDLIKEHADRYGEKGTRAVIACTWSCYRDGPQHCGQCSGCQQRMVAELASGFDVTRYDDPTVQPLKMANWTDSLRWVRDSGPKGLIARGRERWYSHG